MIFLGSTNVQLKGPFTATKQWRPWAIPKPGSGNVLVPGPLLRGASRACRKLGHRIRMGKSSPPSSAKRAMRGQSTAEPNVSSECQNEKAKHLPRFRKCGSHLLSQCYRKRQTGAIHTRQPNTEGSKASSCPCHYFLSEPVRELGG